MSLEGTSFVVVDTETTGSRAGEDRIIEVGAVRVRGGRIVDRFEQLVNPGCAVPRRIMQLTGISTAMLFDQPTPSEVMPAFRAYLGSDVFVAHNLSFDWRFVNAELRSCGQDELTNDSLCTLRLARRLLPGLRSKGLASLADFYGIRNRRHHRALADAEATAEVLLRFLDQMALEFDTRLLSDALAFQFRRYRDLRRQSKHVTRIREEILTHLPEKPGVYFMKNDRGSTIYVGKARNLRSRVRSYFAAIEGHPSRIRKMVRSVRDVEWEVTPSELEALLLESRLIKKLQPAYNRAQRRYVNRPFIRMNVGHAAPRATASAFVHDDGAEYYGPMSSREEARFVVDVIDRFFQLRECDDATMERGRRCMYAAMHRCTAPCEGVSAAYGEEVNRVRAFLLGTDAAVLPRIESAMQEASAEMDYEQAGLLRDWKQRLERMLARREAVASRVLDHNAVVVHKPDQGPVRLLIIRRGRHVETLLPDAGTETLRTAFLRHFGPESTGRDTQHGPFVDAYREREVDERHLLSHWLYVHRNDVRQLHLGDDEAPIDLVRRVQEVLQPAVA